jgi:hypothetical protein
VAKIRNPHGVVQDTDSTYLVRDANGVVVNNSPAYTKYDIDDNRVSSDAAHKVRDAWGNRVDALSPYSFRNAWGEVETLSAGVSVPFSAVDTRGAVLTMLSDPVTDRPATPFQATRQGFNSSGDPISFPEAMTVATRAYDVYPGTLLQSAYVYTLSLIHI